MDDDLRDKRLEDIEQTLMRLERMVQAQQTEIAMLRNQSQRGTQVNPEDYGLPKPRWMQERDAAAGKPQGIQQQNVTQPQNMPGPQSVQNQQNYVPSQPMMSQPMTPQPMMSQPMTPQPMMSQPMTPQPMTPQPMTPQPMTPQPAGSQLRGTVGESIESRVGKSMGIVASVLVFISMVLFATLVYSSLSSVVKVAALFVFSACMLGAGLLWMRRDCNFFALSLTGCGMGAIFLSLFITYMYFHMINQWWLYGLVALWAVGVKFLSGRERYCFEVVGQVGITIAIVFGCSFNRGITQAELYFLTALYICIGLFYMLAGNSAGPAQCFPMAVLNKAAVLALCVRLSGMVGEGAPGFMDCVFTIALSAMNIFIIYWFVVRGRGQNRNFAGAVYAVLTLYGWWVTSEFLGSVFGEIPDGAVFLIKLVIICALMGAEVLRGRLWRQPVTLVGQQKTMQGQPVTVMGQPQSPVSGDFWRHDIIHSIIIYVLYLALVISTLEFKAISDFVGIGLYVFPLLFFGVWLEDRSLVILAYLTLGYHGIVGAGYLTIDTVITVLGAIASGYALFSFRKMYSRWLKCAWYVLMLILFIGIFEDIGRALGVASAIRNVWMYMSVALVNGVVVHIGFTKSWDGKMDEETAPRNLCMGLNAFMLLMGFVYLGNGYYKDFTKLCILAVTALVCLTNVVYIYDKYRDRLWSGIYTGLKLSIFMLVALKSYDVVSPVVSICLIVLAIIFISAGFLVDYRYLRLYGLFLTCFSIIKLLAFDISYNSGVVRAASFLVSGILCFLINLVYDYFNRRKKMEDENISNLK